MQEIVVHVRTHVHTHTHTHTQICIHRMLQEEYTMPGENVPEAKYINVIKKYHIRRWTVTEIMARYVIKYEKCYKVIECQIHIKTSKNLLLL
jgi:hypothetical protein